jgi:hypothetical protein
MTNKPQVANKKNLATQKSQSAAFRKAARELGADESEEQFKETLRTLAKGKPSERGGLKLKRKNAKKFANYHCPGRTMMFLLN